MEQKNALGRRKAAVARVYLSAGTGKIEINDRTLDVFFKEDALRYIVNQPFGIARALSDLDREAYRPALKAEGFLTRDAREVERKKPGQPGARARFQFSKR